MRKIPHKLTVLLVVLILIFAGIGLSYKAYDYTENNPDFCKTCHIMDEAYSKWSKSAHNGINCHACHNPPYIERCKNARGFSEIQT